MKAQILDYHLFGTVTEPHVLKLHVALHPGKDRGTLGVVGLGQLVDEPEHTLGCGKRRLQIGKNVGKFVYRSRKFARILNEGRKVAELKEEDRCGSHGPRERQHKEYAADHYHESYRQIVDEVDRRSQCRAVIVGVVICAAGIVVMLVELADNGRLAPVSAYSALPREHLLGIAVECTELCGTQPEKRPYMLALEPRGYDRYRHGNNEYHDYHRRYRDHHRKRENDRDDAQAYLKQVVRQRRVYGVNVV